MSARLLWPCLLLVVLLVLTLRKTGCKLPQAAAAVRGDPEFRWQQRPGRRRPREGLLNRLLHRSMMYKWEVPAMTDLRDWLKAYNIKNSMGGEMAYNTSQRMLSSR